MNYLHMNYELTLEYAVRNLLAYLSDEEQIQMLVFFFLLLQYSILGFPKGRNTTIRSAIPCCSLSYRGKAKSKSCSFLSVIQ